MRSFHSRSVITLFTTLFLAACSDDAGNPKIADAAASDAAVNDMASGDAAAGDMAPGDSAPADAAVVAPTARGLAVINSDYKSTAISLVDPATGTVVKNNCLHSGSVAPQLSMALSGDVVLPSQLQPANQLVVIDRKNGTLTWVDPTTCTVVRQLNLGTAFAPNPHDVVGISATKSYVTRYGNGPGASTEGNDLLIIDPAGKVGARIDLRPYATKTDTDKATVPGPDRAVLAENGKVYVTLNNLTADTAGGGTGRLVEVDAQTDMVTAQIDLPGLKNCAGLTYVPGVRALAVVCGGLFGDGANQVKASGTAWVDLTKTPAAVTVVAATTFGRTLSFSAIAASGAAKGFVVTPGEFAGPPADQLWVFAFTGGTPSKLFEATAGYTLGGIVLGAGGTKLFVTDAAKAAPKLHIFDLTTTTPTETSVVTNPGTGLPPRDLAWY